MIKQELYINDILVDLDKDVSIYPLFQSPLFTDLKSIVSNRTNNISLPLTPNNAKAVQMFHLADTTDSSYSFPRRWCTVRYYRNGFNICDDGQGMVTKIGGGRIDFSFTWGASSKLQRLFDKKLSDLPFKDDIPWNTITGFGYCAGYENKCGYFKIDFGMGSLLPANKDYIHPCLTSDYLVDLIASHNEIKIDKTGMSGRYLIPCILRPVELNEHPANFDLKKGVPDMTQADFLKGLMQISGVFAYLKDEETIGFLSFKDVLNSNNFFDWTDKVITSSNAFDAPESIEYTLEGFAQRNIFKYAADKDAEESSAYNGVIQVLNQTIDKEKESVKSPFNYTRNGKDNNASIGLYVPQKEDPSIVESINKNLKPRFLIRRTGDTAYFPDSLKWRNILENNNYKAYKETVGTPRVLKLKCRLTDWDLAHIDFSFPVYFKQYGHYYAVIKIQTKVGGISECSFLEIR